MWKQQNISFFPMLIHGCGSIHLYSTKLYHKLTSPSHENYTLFITASTRSAADRKKSRLSVCYPATSSSDISLAVSLIETTSLLSMDGNKVGFDMSPSTLMISWCTQLAQRNTKSNWKSCCKYLRGQISHWKARNARLLYSSWSALLVTCFPSSSMKPDAEKIEAVEKMANYVKRGAEISRLSLTL